MTGPVFEKVVAYVTNRGRLLVFRHTQHPEAGIQVPAGSLRPGEDPAAAALREAQEETGLRRLRVAAYLGEDWVDAAPTGRPGVLHRRFYHLTAAGVPPEHWRHWERDPSGQPGAAYEFALWWCELPGGVPPLAGQQGALLPRLQLPAPAKGPQT